MERASLLKTETDMNKTSELPFASFNRRRKRDENPTQHNSVDAIIVGSAPLFNEP